MAALALLLAAWPAPARGASLQLVFNDFFTPRRVYDIALPLLMRGALFGQAANATAFAPLFAAPGGVDAAVASEPARPKTLAGRVRRAVEVVNFFATPGMYERYYGLGTPGPDGQTALNSDNMGLLLAGGNMLCSEQGFAAALLFSDAQPIARTDVVAHTFAEVADGTRWLLVDPMFNRHLRRADGRYAGSDDLIAYADGDAGRLALAEPLLPRTRDYLALFDRDNFDDGAGEAADAPRATRFGLRAMLPAPRCTGAEDATFAAYREAYLAAERPMPGIGSEADLYVAYLRCNFGRLADTAPRNRLLRLQDNFLKIMAPRWDGAMPWDFYRARQYMLLGRMRKALEVLETLEPTRRVLYSRALAFFALNRREEFTALAPQLKANPFYRDLYYRLTGDYLLPKDQAFFAAFAFRGPVQPWRDADDDVDETPGTASGRGKGGGS
ncbi:MAG: hypothetical protein H0S85_16990 [Desulfovibrionaceae bacterium]|nr:hypothetical protein [Desulfovibrionaceae bacterium]